MKMTVLLALLLTSGTAQAQNTAIAQRDRLVESYRGCVMLTSIGIPGENRLVAEQAFYACSTEEQTLRAWFAVMGVEPAIANSFVLRLKGNMKRIILSDPPHF